MYQKCKILTKPQLPNLQQTVASSSTLATVKTSTSFELSSSHARVTSINSTKRQFVSQSDSGPIKIPTSVNRSNASPCWFPSWRLNFCLYMRGQFISWQSIALEIDRVQSAFHNKCRLQMRIVYIFGWIFPVTLASLISRSLIFA